MEKRESFNNYNKGSGKVLLFKISVEEIIKHFLDLDFPNLIKTNNPNDLLEIIKAIEIIYKQKKSSDYERLLSQMGDIFKNFIKNKSLNKEIIDKFILSDFFKDLLEKEELNKEEKYLDNLIELTKNIYLSEEAESIIIIYLVNKYRGNNNVFYKEKLNEIRLNKNIKEENIIKIGKETIEEIKNIYLGENINNLQNISKPTNSWGNFVDNLKKIGLSLKSLTEIVSSDYKRKNNEILIFNKNLGNYQVFVGTKNYSGIKEPLNIEELTLRKQISFNNPLLKDINDLVEKIGGVDGKMLFEVLSQDNSFQNIDLKTFFVFLREYYTKKGLDYDDFIKRFDETIGINNIQNFTKFDVSEIISDYLDKTFNGEFTKQEYLDFGKKFNSILNQKIGDLIEFFNKKLKKRKI